MDINIIDMIPEDKPHCANCRYWENNGELFGKCKKKDESCPSFAICKEHKFVD